MSEDALLQKIRAIRSQSETCILKKNTPEEIEESRILELVRGSGYKATQNEIVEGFVYSVLRKGTSNCKDRQTKQITSVEKDSFEGNATKSQDDFNVDPSSTFVLATNSISRRHRSSRVSSQTGDEHDKASLKSALEYSELVENTPKGGIITSIVRRASALRIIPGQNLKVAPEITINKNIKRTSEWEFGTFDLNVPPEIGLPHGSVDRYNSELLDSENKKENDGIEPAKTSFIRRATSMSKNMVDGTVHRNSILKRFGSHQDVKVAPKLLSSTASMTHLRRTNTYRFEVGLRKHQYGMMEGMVDGIEESTKTTSAFGIFDIKDEAKQKHFILPASIFKVRWDTVIVILSIVLGIIEPVLIAFKESALSSSGSILTVIEVLFWVDILLTFRTAIKIKGIFILDQRIIARNYLKFWFWIDFVASLPLRSMIDGNSRSLFSLFQLLKLLRLTRVFRIISRFKASRHKESLLLSFVENILVYFLVWHLFACSYFFVCWYEGYGPNDSVDLPEMAMYVGAGPVNIVNMVGGSIEFSTDPFIAVQQSYTGFYNYYINDWVPPSELVLEGSVLAEYCVSFLFALSTTTGSGRDIRPWTTLEHITSSILLVLGMFAYAAIISKITQSVTESESEEQMEAAHLRRISSYLDKRQVMPKMRDRILQWYPYINSKANFITDTAQDIEGQEEEENVFMQLHESLRLELKTFLNRDLLMHVPMFSMITNSICLLDILEMMQTRYFVPDEVIITENDIADSIFVLARGSVALYWKGNDSKQNYIRNLNKGEVFGEMAILLGKRRNASAISKDFTQVLALDQDSFNKVMKDYPEFFQIMQSIARNKIGDGWTRLRSTMRICKYTSLFGMKVDMEVMLGTKTIGDVDPFERTPPSDSILHSSKLFAKESQVFSHYVYKNRKVQARDAMRAEARIESRISNLDSKNVDMVTQQMLERE